MQQMYYCPNCGIPVVYGQAQCSNCKTVLNWQVSQTQGQYQSSSDQYYNRQQQQWYQGSPDYQSAGEGSQDQNQQQAGDEAPRLLQLIKNNRGMIARVSIILGIVVALIVAGIALQGPISKWFAAPVVTSFDADPSTITSGQEATLQWDVTGATSIVISPDIGPVSSSGTRKISPDMTTTYTLVAGGQSGGSIRKSITVTVTAAPPAINSFSLNTGSIYVGQTATLSWNVTGATSVSINPVVGAVSLSGTQNVSPDLTTTYTLTASNNAGNSTASATITVTAANTPVILSFTARPTIINPGESSTLTWDVIGSATVYIDQSLGGVSSKGFKEIIPTETKTYTLTADNGSSKVTKSVTVTVDTKNIANKTGTAITKTPPVINTFSASRNSIALGENITLTWAVDGARTISISPDVGDVPSSGWSMVIPTATTAYKLSAVNTFGTETAETIVSVSVSTDGVAPIIRSFAASPSSITEGGTSNLSWSTKGATIVTINQGIGIPVSKYSQAVSPEQTTAYTLTAINSYGTDNETVTVTVTAGP